MVSTRAVTCAVALLTVVQASKWPLRAPHADSVPPSFDRAMREFAYEHGKALLPRMGKFESLYYALGLNEPTVDGRPDGRPAAADAPLLARARTVGNSGAGAGEAGRRPDERELAAAVHVAPGGDDEGGDGSAARPFGTVQRAVDVAAASRDRKLVLLREGVHQLAEPIRMDASHSHLTIMGHPADPGAKVVSGGVELTGLVWQPHHVDNGSNIYVAQLSGQVEDVPGLQLDGERATRARYPNLPGGIEASPGYGAMIDGGSADWTPPDFGKFGNVSFFTDEVDAHLRNNTPDDWFQHYMIGTDGLCTVYDPPVSYWCSEHPSGGGAFAFRTPSGMVPKKGVLPNAPYKDVSEAVLFVWRPARWANWMFKVGDYDAATGNFTFGEGGNQGARGNNAGGDFFVENVMEELDNPGEFYYDKKTQKLFLFYNGTGAPPADMTVVVPQHHMLMNLTASQANPLVGVTIKDMVFKSTSYTYMLPHGVPSAGDWALDRIGAIVLEGTEGVTIDSCQFERLDGNGVMVSGYNRNATIQSSDFAYLGGNAIAAWGYTNETANRGFPTYRPNTNHPDAGVDGTDGEHPRFTTVVGNSAREVGLYEKQSSFFVQAKTAQSIIRGNVFFNGPRAGINANDGFGGGDEISHNLVFSTCRESGDHGPFNSWDRQPFLTTVRTGSPSMIMQWREIHHNFFIDNYSPQENVDNDDGSAYFRTHDNFFVYGGQGMKNDFGGHDNHHYNNVYAYVKQGLGVCSQLDEHEDYFYNNTLVMTGTQVGSFACGKPGKTVVHDNRYFTPTGAVDECNMPLAQWQAHGEDVGSTVAKTPADDTIIGWGKAVLAN